MDSDARRALVVAIAIGATCGSSTLADAASQSIPARWKNCTVVNKRYPHGVGKAGAHDKTSGEPVTNFTHNNYLYEQR